MSAAATILPTNTRPNISVPRGIRSSRAMIRPRVGAGVMSMKYCSICRTERQRITGRSRAIIEDNLQDGGYLMPSTPQSRSTEVNGVKLHYLIAGKGDPFVLLHGYAETSH